MKDIDYSKLTPMMRQYLETKENYKDSILMFRMGDFYEMFFDDAITASKTLDIVLTGRDAGLDEKIPMCGVPYHAADNYISRLINNGFKVAICEQLEDPKESKGLVKRGVIRVITPGTNLQIAEGDSSSTFLASIYTDYNEFSLSYVDFSTGNLYFTFLKEDYNDSNSNLRNQLSVLEIKELVINNININISDIVERKGILVNEKNTPLEDEILLEFSKNLNSDEVITELIYNNKIVKNSLIQLFSYLKETQFSFINHIRKIHYINLDNYMILDKHTLYSLDVFSERDRKEEGTLLHLMDKTKTSMGYRKLRYFLEHPLKSSLEIQNRLDIVDVFKSNLYDLDEVRSILNEIYDMERLMVRLSGNSNSPKDLLQLKKSLKSLPILKNKIVNKKFNLDFINKVRKLDLLSKIYDLLESSINEEAPFSPKEGEVIKGGFSKKLDEIKSTSINSKTWILNYENKLKKETGIGKLRVKYNKILGYFIEVTKSHLDKVPDYFIRKQTLVGSERYFTDELKSTEMSILNSKDRINSFEYDLYESIRQEILNNYNLILDIADIIAEIDVFTNFAFISHKYEYKKPNISKSGEVKIIKGRHPIVEKNVDIFIDNDTVISNDKNFIILTGPNMAGKSTYMRQVALISIIMQVGCFVPAEDANLPVFDRIFTRIGAHDNLYLGESTFMVEMKEMADIINNASKNSLIILDEVGRGTSTYDGLSLAKALIEYIVESIDSKTIFATHFHELTSLDFKYANIKNQTMAVKEKDGNIIFLRKVIDGSTDRSYGIHVATLAGIKDSIVRKAKTYLDEYENRASNYKQIGFLNNNFSTNLVETIIDTKYEEIIDEILDIDLNSMTPIEAMLKIRDLKDAIKDLDEK